MPFFNTVLRSCWVRLLGHRRRVPAGLAPQTSVSVLPPSRWAPLEDRGPQDDSDDSVWLWLLELGLPRAVCDNDPEENTLLHRAAAAGLPKTVRWLCAQGEDPNVRNLAGEAPLHAVLGAPVLPGTLSNRALVIHYLLRAGADPSLRSFKGFAPMTYALHQCPQLLPALCHESLKQLAARPA